jgi:hypothetical protein
MADFESKLKSFRVRQASQGLDERVLAAKAGLTPASSGRAVRQIPLWAAMAASLTLGLVGFTAGLATRASPPAISAHQASPASVQVIYHAPLTGDPFDFTRNPQAILPHCVKATLQTTKKG